MLRLGARRARRLFLRSKLYPLILGSVGRNVVFGANVVLRHPAQDSHRRQRRHRRPLLPRREGHRQRRHHASERRVRRPQHDPELQERRHHRRGQAPTSASTARSSRLRKCGSARSILIAAYTYLVGGDHLYDRVDIPVLEQGRTAQGIDVGDARWLGAHVVVTDGSRIGRDAIIGAGAVVVGEIPEFAIAAGIPAKCRIAAPIRRRRHETASNRASSADEPVEEPRLNHVRHRRHRRTVISSRSGPARTICSAWCGRCTIAAQTKRAASRCRASALGDAPPGDRRSRRRAAAVQQRDRRRSSSSPTARSTTSPSSARELEARGHAFHSRSDIEVLVARLRGVGRGLPRRGCAACSRWRCGTAARGRCWRRAIAPARSRSIGRRRRTACCSASEVKALLVAAGSVARARSRGARPVPDLRIRHRAADHLQGHSQAAGRRTTCAIATAQVDGAPLLGCGGRAAHATWTRRRRGDAAAGGARDGGRAPDDGGRAARRVPLRRHRFERDRRAA